MEATDLYTDEASHDLHELSETLLHHLDEEERDILNPARSDVARGRPGPARRGVGRPPQRAAGPGCGSLEQVRALLDA